MKKYWLILLLVFSPSLLFAWGVMGVSGGVVASGSTPDYVFYWSGNSSNNADYNSGASTTATVTGSFTRSTAAHHDGANGGDTVNDTQANGLTFALPTGWDANEGTCVFWWNPQTLTNARYIEILGQQSGSNSVAFKYDSGYVYVLIWDIEGVREAYYNLSPTVGTWYKVIIRWKHDGSNVVFSIQVDSNSETEKTYADSGFSHTYDKIKVGTSYYNSCDCYIDEFYIYADSEQTL